MQSKSNVKLSDYFVQSFYINSNKASKPTAFTGGYIQLTTTYDTENTITADGVLIADMTINTIMWAYVIVLVNTVIVAKIQNTSNAGFKLVVPIQVKKGDVVKFQFNNASIAALVRYTS